MERVTDFLTRLRHQRNVTGWLIALAFCCGVVPIVTSFTAHTRCSNADPACVHHSYTLVHLSGVGVIGIIALPALISLVVGALLRIKVERRSTRADRAALLFAVLNFLIALVGMTIEGLMMLASALVTIAAVAATPLPADPNDPLLHSVGALPRLSRSQ